MAVKIGHASIDENGKISGGIAGNQNGKELCIRDWYNKPFTVLLRPLNDSIAEQSAQACEAGCKNFNIGYDQKARNTLHIQAQLVKYDLSKIKSPCETDCSAFMTVCAIAGGVNELEYTGNAPTTSTMVNAFTKTGKYQKLTDSKYLTSDKYLKRGDILVKPGSHTVMVLENGSEVVNQAKKTPVSVPKVSLSYPCRGIDVAAWQTNLDYQKLKDEGVQFAILKAIRKDNQADDLFEKHYSGFTKVGIPILAVYNYSYAQTVEKAKIDARAVIKVLNGRKIPVCLDVEDKVQQSLGKKLIEIINAYQSVIEEAGLPFIVYTGLSFYHSWIKPYKANLNCNSFWIARYYNGYKEMSINQTLNDRYKPDVPGLIAWQFTSSLRIAGSGGKLDCNILYQPIETINTTQKVLRGTVTASTLNVREKPTTASKIVGYLKKSDIVTIIGTDIETGWYQIDTYAWVSNKYISIN